MNMLRTAGERMWESMNRVEEIIATTKLNELLNKKEEEKISHSNNQLQYQLEKRREEYQTIIKFYKATYVLLMFSSVMLVTNDIWAGINIDGMFATFWIFGWMIMNPLQKLIVMTIVDPKLDEKYPLTMNRLDKDHE